MQASKNITVAGQTFDSVQAAAKHFNVPVKTAFNRLKQGMPSDQVFDQEARRPPFVVGRRTFSSVSEAAKHFNVPSQTVHHRLHRGWSPQQAVGVSHPPEQGGHEDLHAHEGAIRVNWQYFSDEAAAAKHFNVPLNVVRRQYKAGLTYEQIFGIAKNPSKRTEKIRQTRQKLSKKRKTTGTLHLQRNDNEPLTIKGFVYPNLNAAAQAYGHTLQEVKKRLNNMSLEQALGLDPNVPVPSHAAHTANGKRTVAVTKKAAHPISVAGKQYSNIDAAAKAFGLAPQEVKRALVAGKSLESALGLHSGGAAQPKPVTVQGVDYPSIKAAAQAHNMSPAKVRGRLRRGQTIEQALELEKPSTAPQTTTPATGAAQPKPVTVQGVDYPSIKAAAQAHNMSPAKVRGRLRRGNTIEQALELEKTTPTSKTKTVARATGVAQPKPVTVQGVDYPSIKAAALAHDLTPALVRGRLRRGKTIEQALDKDTAAPPTTTKNNLVGQAHPITVAGVKYPSIKAAAQAHKLEPALIRGRLHRGMTIDKAFNLENKTRGQAKTITVAGNAYPSIKAAAQAHNLSPNNVRGRLHRGWSIEEALGLTEHTHEHHGGTQGQAKTVTVQGKTFPSIKVAALAHNIDPALVRGRLHRGWDNDAAFSTPAQPAGRPKMHRSGKPPKGNVERRHLNHPVTVNNTDYPSIKAAAQALNINAGVVRARLYRGWSVEEAFETQPRQRTRTAQPKTDGKTRDLRIGSTTYPSIKAAAQAHNIDPAKVRGRLHRNWTLEEALEIVPRTKDTAPAATHSTRNKVTLRGATYPSIKAAAEAFSLRPELVRGRLHRGWTVDEAFELTDRQLDENGHPQRETRGRGEPLTIKGTTYDSISDAARSHQLSVAKVHGRLHRGWSMEEALELSPRKDDRAGSGDSGQFVVYNRSYPNLETAANAYHLDPESIRHHMRQGQSANAAFDHAQEQTDSDSGQGKQGHTLTLRNERYSSISAAARHYRVSASKLRYLIKQGKTPDQALSQLTGSEAPTTTLGMEQEFSDTFPLTLEGRDFDSLAAFISHYHLDPMISEARLLQGWKPIQLIGLAPPPTW
jgi:hypothetical protein